MSMKQIDKLHQKLDRTLETLEKSTRTPVSEGSYMVIDSDDMSLTLGAGGMADSLQTRPDRRRSRSFSADTGFDDGSRRVSFTEPVKMDEGRESIVPEPTCYSTPRERSWERADRKMDYSADPEARYRPDPRTGYSSSYGTEWNRDGDDRRRRDMAPGFSRVHSPERSFSTRADRGPSRPEENFRFTPVSLPRYRAGDDWRCFLTEFGEMVQLSRMRPEIQLLQLKQSIPEDAKRILYQHKVVTVERALGILTDLYEPKRDSWTLLQDLQRLSQNPGERLRALAGRIQDVARRYAETVHISEDDLEQMTKDRFKHAVSSDETRDHLLWEETEMSLEMMIRKAQKFEDSRNSGRKPVQKALRTEQSSDKSKLVKEVADLKRQLASLQSSRSITEKKQSFQCWNCGDKGHYSRNCKRAKKGDGFTFRPKRDKPKVQKQRVSETQTDPLN